MHTQGSSTRVAASSTVPDRFQVHDPATGQVLGSVPSPPPEDPDVRAMMEQFIGRGTLAWRALTLEGALGGESLEGNLFNDPNFRAAELPGANGIEISPDGKTLYVAGWGSQSFFRLTRGAKEPKRDEIPLGFRIDNIRWARDGSLLGTGQAINTGQPMQTVIVKIDPKTLKVTELLRRPAVPGFSGGTVAVEVGRQLWVGSYTGDRIAIFPAP